MAIKNIFNLDVDIKQKNYIHEPLVTQNDKVVFILRLSDNGLPFDMTGVTTYTLVSVRPDKQSVQTLGIKTAVNEITFNLGSTEISIPGEVNAAIQLYDANGRVSSIPFSYKVLSDMMKDYVPSENEKTLIELVLGEGPAILAETKQATINANQATNAINALMPNLSGLEAIDEYDASTAYLKNNIVSFNGSSYIAKVDTKGNLPTDTTYWVKVADKGVKGDTGATGEQGIQGGQGIQGETGEQGIQGLTGDTGEKGETGAGVKIIGSLADESELPESGELGDAYLIAGNLHVWNGSVWENVGNIKGPKGDKGETGITGATGLMGETGDKGDPFIYDDFTEGQLDGLKGPKGDKGEGGTGTVTSVNNIEPVDGNVTLEIPDLEMVDNQLANHESRLNILESGTGTIATNVTGLYRGQAWLNLQLDAVNRIDGGVTFADDMGLNRFGMEFDEVASENVVIRDGKMLMNAIENPTHTAADKTVASGAFSTEGNGGRRLVRLKDGSLISALRNPTDSNRLTLYKSTDNGLNWTVFLVRGTNVGDASICALGDEVHLMYRNAVSHSVIFNKYNKDGNQIGSSIIEVNGTQTAIGNVSLAIDPTNGRLHAAWASKNAALPNSFNIRYSKSIDGGVTWSAVEQLTGDNTIDVNNISLSIVLKNGDPIIIYNHRNIPSKVYRIRALIKGSGWGSSNIINIATYDQSYPSAVVDKDGVIHVAWQGKDSVDTGLDYIRYSKSTDGGTTWSPMQKLTAGVSSSISTNSNGHIFIAHHMSGYARYVKSVDGGFTWGEIVNIGGGPNPSSNPSTLDDNSLDFTTPLAIRMNTNAVMFNGDWSEQTEVPKTTASAVYNLPSTDYVGAFVEKTGEVDVQAYLNDELMSSDLESNEYLFQKNLPSKVPVKLRLELSRTTVDGGENDAVTRILGGRS